MSGSHPTTRTIIAYDITDNRRRKRLADLLEGYGQRVQYSVFDCPLTARQRRDLLRAIRQKIDPDCDRVALYPIAANLASKVVHLGRQENPPPPHSVVI